MNLIQVESTDSTNLEAERILLSNKANTPFVVLTSEQLNGRGQGNHKWLSEKGLNITCSFVVSPLIDSVHQFYLTAMASVSILETVSSFLPDSSTVKIKWTNDVYVGNNKIAGILISNKILNNKIISSIIGIGLNVNQTIFPEDVPNPTSLQLETNQEMNVKSVFSTLCNRFEANYAIMLRNPKKMAEEYRANLFMLNKPYKYTINGKEEIRAIRDVNDFGEMIW